PPRTAPDVVARGSGHGRTRRGARPQATARTSLGRRGVSREGTANRCARSLPRRWFVRGISRTGRAFTEPWGRGTRRVVLAPRADPAGQRADAVFLRSRRRRQRPELQGR